MSEILKKTVSGISWNFKSQLFTQSINFIVSIALMRLITPEDFGKFAMVFVVMSFFQILRDAGLSAAIIQKMKALPIDLSTTFWLQILLGGSIAFLLSNLGDTFNTFYNQVELDQITVWLSLEFFLGSIGLLPTALLKKELQFEKLFYIHLSSMIISSSIAIILALQGWGYLSLVSKLIVWTFLNSLLTLIVVDWKPKFQFSGKALNSLLRFGIPVTGNHLLSYVVRNVDDFFIGRVIGADFLGWYNRAYALMLIPLANITSVLQNVLFPAWSKMVNDPNTIKSMYLKVSGMIAFFSFPALSFLALFAESIIKIVFGEDWLPMVDTLQILCLIGIFQSVSSLVGLIFLVFDENKLLFKINLVSSSLMIVSIIWAVYTFQSIEITALVYALVSFILLCPIFYFAGKIINTTVISLMNPMAFPMLFSIIMSGISWLFFKWLPFEITWIKLLLSMMLGLVIYGVLFLKFKREIIDDFLKVIQYNWSNG